MKCRIFFVFLCFLLLCFPGCEEKSISPGQSDIRQNENSPSSAVIVISWEEEQLLNAIEQSLYDDNNEDLAGNTLSYLTLENLDHPIECPDFAESRVRDRVLLKPDEDLEFTVPYFSYEGIHQIRGVLNPNQKMLHIYGLFNSLPMDEIYLLESGETSIHDLCRKMNSSGKFVRYGAWVTTDYGVDIIKVYYSKDEKNINALNSQSGLPQYREPLAAYLRKDTIFNDLLNSGLNLEQTKLMLLYDPFGTDEDILLFYDGNLEYCGVMADASNRIEPGSDYVDQPYILPEEAHTIFFSSEQLYPADVIISQYVKEREFWELIEQRYWEANGRPD